MKAYKLKQITSAGSQPDHQCIKPIRPPKKVLLVALILYAALAHIFYFPASAAACTLPTRTGPVADVRATGAKGDGRTDDTAAIQRAIDAVAGRNGTVRVPAGRYMIDAAGNAQLNLKSRMTLALDAGAVLKAIPNAAETYALFWITGATDVAITGGTLEGERDEHRGSSGEWGMGLRIGGKSRDITVSGTTLRKFWGDGIYLAGAHDVRICGATFEANRRQGLSVIEVDGLFVTRSTFKDTRGTRPSAGIDFEPNAPTERIVNVRIERSKFLDNAGPGILVAGKRGHISAIGVDGNTFRGRSAIEVENAPDVSLNNFCRNRAYLPPPEAEKSLAAAAEPEPVLVQQSHCGDRRIMKVRSKKKG